MRSDPTPDALERLRTACSLARRAGSAILARYGETERHLKAGGSPVTEADLESNRLIINGLHDEYPGEPVRSEESGELPGIDGEGALWVVDPLDGTKEYLAGNGEFAVMIGLAYDGSAFLGVVYLPVPNLLYGAARGHGAWVERDGERQAVRCEKAVPGAIRLISSRSHPDPLLERLKKALEVATEERAGSVGVKCARIAGGAADAYIHPVPFLNEWDTCAPEVLVREAGGHVTDCRGSELRYGKRDPRHAHGIIACGGGIRDWILERAVPLYVAARGDDRREDTNGA